MLFVSCLFALLLLFSIPFFSAFVQTIKNLMFFVFLVFLVSVNLTLFYGIEFFPIFFILIYIGAIIVSTLFMVLTFDLRYEYSRSGTLAKKGLFNAACYLILTPALFWISFILERIWWPYGSVGEADRLTFYHACKTTAHLSGGYCEHEFGKDIYFRGLYHSISNRVSDVGLIADNFYTQYVFLFLVLGIILTIALFAALTLVKGARRR